MHRSLRGPWLPASISGECSPSRATCEIGQTAVNSAGMSRMTFHCRVKARLGSPQSCDRQILITLVRALASAVLSAVLIAAPAGANAQELTQRQWAEKFEATLPSFICRENWYFRQCFFVTSTQCVAASQAAAKTCLDRAKGEMPAMIQSREESASWGAKVASCTGALLEDRLRRRRRSPARRGR